MIPGKKNSFKSLKTININGNEYSYYSLIEAEKNGLQGISKLPKSLKVLFYQSLKNLDLILRIIFHLELPAQDYLLE